MRAKINRDYGFMSPDSTSVSSSINTSTITGNTASDMQDLVSDTTPEITPVVAGVAKMHARTDSDISLAELRASVTQRKLQRAINRVTKSSGNATVDVKKDSIEEYVKHVDVAMSRCMEKSRPQDDFKCVPQENLGATATMRPDSELLCSKLDAMARVVGLDKCDNTILLEQKRDADIQSQFNRRMNMDAESTLGETVDVYNNDVEKQSSFSCEIQVPSDYDSFCHGGYVNPTTGSLSPSSSSSSSVGLENPHRRHDDDDSKIQNDSHGGLMKESGAVAMVKSSYDPHQDFKDSMLEMVLAKRVRGRLQLQQLLQCYLSLNSDEYHTTIVKVFHELCSELFHHNE